MAEGNSLAKLRSSRGAQSITRGSRGRPGPPLDYSFLELESIADIMEEKPRSGKRAPPLETKTDEKGEGEIEVVEERPPRPSGQLITSGIRLNNNAFEDWGGFEEAMREVLWEPELLSWVDLSFNKLTTIDEIILHYPSIGVLNLHANNIAKFSEVEKLAELPNLRKLTLHGNPIEEMKGYRLYVLVAVPQIASLDFGPVTRRDKDTALRSPAGRAQEKRVRSERARRRREEARREEEARRLQEAKEEMERQKRKMR